MLNPDSLVERAKLRSQVSTWRAVTFIVLGLIVLTALGTKGVKSLKDGPMIARVEVSDIILEDQDRLNILKDIGEDKDIKAVIMHINSPGGSAVGGETLYNAIVDLNKKKPVVVVMDSLAASAAYLISLGAEHIFAHNGTITGSIGVIMEIPNLKEAGDKLGIKFDYVRTSDIKGSPNLFEPKNEKALAVLDKMMHDFYGYFVSTVAAERKLTPEKALELADGRIFSGKAAVDNNLVDDIGGEPDARQWLADNKKIPLDMKIEEVKLYKPKEPFEEFLGSLSQNLGIKAFSDRIFNFKGLLL